MFWKKKDKAPAIEKIVLQLVEMEQKTGVLPFLSMKEAADYASGRGSTVVQHNLVQCYPIIGSHVYKLDFTPRPEGGAILFCGPVGRLDEVDYRALTAVKGRF